MSFMRDDRKKLNQLLFPLAETIFADTFRLLGDPSSGSTLEAVQGSKEAVVGEPT